MRLSKRVAQEPEPKGDATLILRSHHFPNGQRLHRAPTSTSTTAATSTARPRRSSRPPRSTRDYNDLVVKAALAARALPPAQARQRMIDATWGGKEPTKADLAPPAAAADAAKRKGTGTWAPSSEKTIDENRIWFGSTDALLAGAGRKDVRAGVLLLLATIDTVKVTETAGDARR